jgi:glycosyltransferase involved in cell wall biosynthesis
VRIFILGCAGIPARYGGFEVFAENVSDYLAKEFDIYVACSKRLYSSSEREPKWHNLNRFFIPFRANGIQSIWYDFFSLLIACIKSDFIIMLGSGSGFSIFLFKIFIKTPIAVHIDGVEWKREKWGCFSKLYLKLNTFLCYKFVNYLIVDNERIVDLIPKKYIPKVVQIAYGCDHLPVIKNLKSPQQRPYALSIARAEPENNIQLIIDTFKIVDNMDLIIISNWNDTKYGQFLFKKNSHLSHIKLIGPIYNDPNTIQQYRLSCKVYIHGHSAGGTNPSLIEAMSTGKPIIAHDNIYNRTTTGNLALYFKDPHELLFNLNNLETIISDQSVNKLKNMAYQQYKWDKVSKGLIDMIKNRNINNP